MRVIEKSQTEQIRVQWSEYKGYRYLDIRLFAELPNSHERTPTKKGITLKPELVPELIEALQALIVEGG